MNLETARQQPAAARRATRLMMMSALLFGVGVALAQAPLRAPATAAPPLPEALQGVPPAGAQCRGDEADPARPGQPLDAAPPAADLACALPAEGAAALQKLAARPRTALVDVRAAADYDAAHIDGALNLALGQIRTKSFLRDKELILVGSGKAEGELYEACAALKAQGFDKVRVLQGGMAAWRGQGAPLIGQAERIDAVPRLSPAELWLESHFPANLVLLAAPPADLAKALPAAGKLRDASAKAVKAAVQQRLKKRKKAPLAAVVLAADGKLDAQAIDALRRAIQPVPLLLYREGAAAYLVQLRQNKAVWAAQARGPKRPGCGR